ncbi:hypothetical protein WR25_10874 [Diploscapter pachys]|uniref:Uncharacterized protein n=1 Tax=Diploscapter pachys TaxID=2018661 RepID=A0A2A2LZ91_9BILA|nr:hypothetical protein WR25_10874 [Diploscapter pachys]
MLSAFAGGRGFSNPFSATRFRSFRSIDSAERVGLGLHRERNRELGVGGVGSVLGAESGQRREDMWSVIRLKTFRRRSTRRTTTDRRRMKRTQSEKQKTLEK